MLTALAVELRGVAASRVENAPFWWALLRTVLYPNANAGPGMTYEQVRCGVCGSWDIAGGSIEGEKGGRLMWRLPESSSTAGGQQAQMVVCD